MNYNYALISDGIVENIISLYPGNAKEFPTAVPMDDYPVAIGDTYDGTYFYHNGEQLKTEKQCFQEENAKLITAFSALGLDFNSMEETTNE